jgi:glycosyltransferase involved in cell wall biosynthesis
MRIAHIVNTLPPYWSGTGMVALNLSQALTRRGHDVSIFTPLTSQNKKTKYDSIKVSRQFTLFRAGNAPLCPGILNIKNFDLIHLHFPYYFGAEMTLLSSVLRRIPYVVTYHNDVLKPGVVGWFVKLHSKYLAPTLLSNSAFICIMNRSFANSSVILRALPDKEKMVVIPQGIDIDRFLPGVTDPSVKKSIGNKEFILFVRTLDEAHHHSGLIYLLDAMRNINSEFDLVVVGDGAHRNKYEQLAVEQGIANRVHFLGAISNEILPAIYATATLFILPSAETENASVVLMEAMACATPVVATDIGGTRDTDSLAYAVNDLLSNPSKAIEMGKSAREKVLETSSWDRIAEMYERVYRKSLCDYV